MGDCISKTLRTWLRVVCKRVAILVLESSVGPCELGVRVRGSLELALETSGFTSSRGRLWFVPPLAYGRTTVCRFVFDFESRGRIRQSTEQTESLLRLPKRLSLVGGRDSGAFGCHEH